ncbi:MAG: HIRAN domain-containing protein [Gemmatimonadota bacterium]|nr:HIRAN domain-containing protein [Gemmatimonadota bacterium]
MSEKTLFLAWQDRKPSRAWFPVGQLDANVEQSMYRFRYINGAKKAKKEGFTPLLDFPDLKGDYRSSELFPLFKNRVMNPARPDFPDYLLSLDLPEKANPIEILARNGGTRVTDTYEVFPKLTKHVDGSFTCRFFLHGWRYINNDAKVRLDKLAEGESLFVTLELTNPATQLAVQIQTTDYHMIGWAPRYLVHDLAKAMANSRGLFEAKVARLNPNTVILKQRALIEMRGHWGKHEPMSSKDFQLLAPQD